MHQVRALENRLNAKLFINSEATVAEDAFCKAVMKEDLLEETSSRHIAPARDYYVDLVHIFCLMIRIECEILFKAAKNDSKLKSSSVKVKVNIIRSLGTVQHEFITKILIRMTTLATYKKRGGTTNRGKEFESLLGAFYAIKLTFSPSVIDFQVFINNDFFGDFDDVILRIKYTDGKVKVFAFQLKHVEKAKTLQTSALSAKSGEFSIYNCFEIYKKILKLDYFYFIACTNRNANFKDGTKFSEFEIKREKCLGDGLFDTNNGSNWGVYKFCSTSEEYSNFLSKFYLYSNQQNDINLKESFVNFLKSKIQGDVFSLFYEYMRVWSAGSFILTKLDVVMKLSELLFSPMIKSLNADIINHQTKLLEEAIMRFDFTLVESCGKDVTKIWQKTTTFCDNIKISKASVKYGLTIKGVKKIQDLDSDQKNKALWFLGETPLAVNVDSSKESQIRSALDLLASCPVKRKVILIGDFLYTCEKAFIFSNLDNISILDKLRQNISKSFRCTLQEKHDLPIEDLNAPEAIKVGELVQIALNPSFNIGEQAEQLPPCYIPRAFYQVLVRFDIIDALADSKIMLSCNGHLAMAKRHFQRRIVKTTCKGLETLKNFIFVNEEEFTKEEVAEQNTYVANGSHHLRVVPNHHCLEWLNSEKQTEEVVPFRIENTKHIFEEHNLEKHYQNKIRLLVSDSGTGKTSLLKQIKNLAPPDVWVFLLNLKDPCFTKFFKDSNEDVWSFLIEFIGKTNNYNNFETKVLEAFEKDKIILLWDGFEELPENCSENFFKTVEKINGKNQAVQSKTIQWITAKPSSKKLLENRFDVFAIAMVPFSQDQQISYIKSRSNVTDSKILDKFFSSLHVVEDTHYLGVPLHLYILTENFNKNPNCLSHIFTLTDMCHIFIEDKYTHYLEESGLKNLQSIESLIAAGKTHRINQYKCAAICTFFPEFARKHHLNISDDFVEDLTKKGDFLGLITKINDDGTVIFENTFFGEYLSALGFVEYHSKDLIEIIFEERNRSIKFMFDLIAAKQEPIFLSILYRQFQKLKEHTIALDTFGRNPLHILCSYGAKHPVCWTNERGLLVHGGNKIEADEKNLLDAVLYLMTKCNPSDKDKLFQLTTFEYAAHAFCLGIINTMSADFPNILSTLPNYCDLTNVMYYALKFNYTTIFKNVAEAPSATYFDDGNLLHLAVKFGREDFLKWILEAKLFVKSINKKNPSERVPMQLASASGNLNIIKYLKERGGTLPLRSPSLLSLAVDEGYEDIVKFLLESNCSPDEYYQDDFYTQSLILAIKHGYIDICQLLMQHGVRYSNIGKASMNGFHIALEHKQLKVADFFLNQGVSIDVLDLNYQNSYHHAAMKNEKSVFLFLLERNGKIGTTDRSGNTPLHYAAQYGSLEVAELLIAAGGWTVKKNKQGYTPFHLAIYFGQIDVARILGVNEINVPNKYGRTPMHSAALAGLKDCLEFLLDHGGCAECMDGLYGRRPIHYAAWNGYDECVELLVHRGAEIDAQCYFGYTPLHLAVESRSFESCQILLKAGACITTENKSFGTPLNFAHHAEDRNLIILMYEYVPKTLMEEPHISNVLNCIEDINAVLPSSTNGSRPIHLACSDINLEGVIYLLKKNVDIAVADNDGNTPLHCAIRKFPAVDIAQLLINLDNKKYLANARTNQGLTALHLAAQAGCFQLISSSSPFYYRESLKIVETLIKAGAEVNAEDEDGFTPLHYAAHSGSLEIVQKLVETGSLINHQNKYARTALHMASTKGWIKIVKFLLQHEASVDVHDKDGDTSFDDAYTVEQPRVIEVFAKMGVVEFQAEKRNRLGRTPLHMAAKKNNVSLVKYFIKKKVSLDVVDFNENTPLDDALYNRHFKLVDILLPRTTLFDAKKYNKHYKRYPLHVAVTKFRPDFTKLLLKKGAQVNVLDKDDNTPLHIALQCEHHCVAEVLAKLTSDEDVNQRNKQGQTPLLLTAKLRNAGKIEKILIKKGARIDIPDNEGNTPFTISFHQYSSLIIEEDLSIFSLENFDWSAPSKKTGNNLLHIAMKENLKTVAEGLIKRGVSINSVNYFKNTPLMEAITENQLSLAEDILIQCGNTLDINKQNKHGKTLLHLAASKKAASIVQKLLDLGASPDLTSINGETALDNALTSCKIDCFRLLFDIRPDTNLHLVNTGMSGNSALHLAVQMESVWLVKLCLERGLKINLCNRYALTPVHLAVENENLELLRMLLESDETKETVNVSDRNGQTFLHSAARNGQLEIVKILVEKGAKIQIYDGDGKTPYELAEKNEHIEICQFLKNVL